MRRRRCSVCRKPFEQEPTGRPRVTCSPACKQAAYRRRNRKLKSTREIMGSSVEWPTDPVVFAELDRRFGPFDLDPCATDDTATCRRYFTTADDGLAQEWTGRVYMNPPYGRAIGDWMRKAWEASQTTAELVVCLVPSRTGSKWWHEYAIRGEIEFLRGRLRFGECRNSAPFDSALVVFRNAKTVTKQALGEAA